MQQYIQALEQRLLFYGRRAGIKLFAGLIAAFLVAVGIGFLMFGLWILASVAWGPVAAAFVIGGGFVLLGGVAFWAGTLHRRTPPPMPTPAYSSPQSASIVALVEAFMVGLNAGKDKGGRKDD